MITIILKNKKQSMYFDYDHGFLVKAVSGLNSADPVVSTTKKAYTDGSYISGDSVERRIVNMSVVPVFMDSARQKMQEIVDFVVPHETYEIIVTRNGKSRKIYGLLNREIETSRSGVHWAQIHSIEFVCVSPYWQDVTDQMIVFRENVPLLTFPLSFYRGAGTTTGLMITGDQRFLINDGAIPTGIVATIYARGGAVKNPSVGLSPTVFVRVLVEMQRGDVLTISTVPGEKYILLNGDKYMRFDRQSTFFQAERGVSEVFVNAEDGTLDNVSARVIYNNQYSGV